MDGGQTRNSTTTQFTQILTINFSEKTTIGLDVTHMHYLAKQPGGLSDAMFRADPRQTNRERNWFQVNWNMAALHLDHRFNAANEFNLRVFGPCG